jgi:hypothetical protein
MNVCRRLAGDFKAEGLTHMFGDPGSKAFAGGGVALSSAT